MREKDNLEEFISTHRSDFDHERPSLRVWTAIERQFADEYKKPSRTWMKMVAAAALILVGVAVGVLAYPRIEAYMPYQSFAQQEELQHIETYFAQEVSTRYSQLTGSYGLTEQKQDLDQIDQMIASLKADLKYAPRSSRDQIIKAIITSYEAKIALLEKMLFEKNKLNHHQNNRDVEI